MITAKEARERVLASRSGRIKNELAKIIKAIEDAILGEEMYVDWESGISEENETYLKAHGYSLSDIDISEGFSYRLGTKITFGDE